MSHGPLNRTPFHPWSADRGARFVDFAGWEMPMSYGSIIDEHHACRTAAAFFDVSHMGRLRFTGRHARRFLDHVCTRQVMGMQRGMVRYSLVCNERGGVRDDVLVYCYEEDDYLMVVNASNRLKILDWFRGIKEREKMTFAMEDVTMETAMAAIQGPKVIEIVGTMSREIPGLKRYRFAEKSLMIAKLTVSRTGYTGEDGFEILVERGAAVAVWNALLAAGKDLGLMPCGLGARDLLRLEMGYLLSGTDFDGTQSTLETGPAWAIKWDHAFIGREAMMKQKERGGYRKLVGLELQNRGIPRHGYPVVVGNREVGMVTSGTLSPILQKGIALAYVDAELTKENTELAVRIRDNYVRAIVVKPPFIRKG